MGAKLREVHDMHGNLFGYHMVCPACLDWYNKTKRNPRTDAPFKGVHGATMNPERTFNGSLEKPTVTPPVKISYPDGNICHFWIRNGQIKYCADSTHFLAGHTVEMIDFPESLHDYDPHQFGGQQPRDNR